MLLTEKCASTFYSFSLLISPFFPLCLLPNALAAYWRPTFLWVLLAVSALGTKKNASSSSLLRSARAEKVRARRHLKVFYSFLLLVLSAALEKRLKLLFLLRAKKNLKKKL